MYCDDFNTTFPSYHMAYLREAVITEEQENAKVKKITWEGSTFQVFDTHIVKDMTSFFRIAGAPNLFFKDCDGIFLVNENDGQKYMVLNELKSTFDSTDIYNAKRQILSSYIKFNLLLHLFQGYNPDDFIVIGFIFSKPANKGYIRDLYKQSLFPKASRLGQEANFVLDLCTGRNQSCEVRKQDLTELQAIPLGEHGIFRSIRFQHIDVPDDSGEVTLNIKDYL